MTSRKYNSPFLDYDVINCQICHPMRKNSNRGHIIAHAVEIYEKQFKKLFVAKLPINKVVFATFFLNPQNASFFFNQKIGWTPCDKNMIAAPLENFSKKISPNFEVKKKLKVTKFQLSR